MGSGSQPVRSRVSGRRIRVTIQLDAVRPLGFLGPHAKRRSLPLGLRGRPAGEREPRASRPTCCRGASALYPMARAMTSAACVATARSALSPRWTQTARWSRSGGPSRPSDRGEPDAVHDDALQSPGMAAAVDAKTRLPGFIPHVDPEGMEPCPALWSQIVLNMMIRMVHPALHGSTHSDQTRP